MNNFIIKLFKNNNSEMYKVIELFKNNDLISLGYCCYPKFFIDKIIKKETQFFDWIGSSTWSIIKLLENNFENVLNKDNYYYPCNHFINHYQKYCIVNKEYYLRFTHDGDFLKTDIDWDIFKNKYMRRINRFDELLKSDKRILFFYLEENDIDRYDNLYEEIKQYYPKDKINYNIEQSKLEQERMFNIVKIIKTKYNKHNFNIIYFSHLIDKTHYTDNIIFIKTDCHYNNFKWTEWGEEQCLKSILANYNFIYNILNL